MNKNILHASNFCLVRNNFISFCAVNKTMSPSLFHNLLYFCPASAALRYHPALYFLTPVYSAAHTLGSVVSSGVPTFTSHSSLLPVSTNPLTPSSYHFSPSPQSLPHPTYYTVYKFIIVPSRQSILCRSTGSIFGTQQPIHQAWFLLAYRT